MNPHGGSMFPGGGPPPNHMMGPGMMYGGGPQGSHFGNMPPMMPPNAGPMNFGPGGGPGPHMMGPGGPGGMSGGQPGGPQGGPPHNAGCPPMSTSGGITMADKSARSIFVGNIPYEATEEKLVELFGQAGPVASFRLVFDRESGKPKGYGFCEYTDVAVANSALRNLQNIEFNGRPLRIGPAAGEQTSTEVMGTSIQSGGMAAPAVGPPQDTPYGDPVDPKEAPEAISRAVASLPPEQMFDLMVQMKQCVQRNPGEARSMLLQNPQLAYALLQAQIVMKIVDPKVAIALLNRGNEQKSPLIPTPLSSGPNVPVPAPVQPPVSTGSMGPPPTQPSNPAMPPPARGPPPTIPPPAVPPGAVGPYPGGGAPPPRHAPPPAGYPPNTGIPMAHPYGGGPPRGYPMPAPGHQPRPAGPPLSGNLLSGPAGGSDQDKAALVLQVLQLSDEQIAMLPEDQRMSIMILKEQIAAGGSL